MTSNRGLSPGEEEALRAELERALPQQDDERIADISRRPSADCSWYGADILQVRMTSGRSVELFLKDFGSSVGHQRRHAQQELGGSPNRSDLAERRERERNVYRELVGRIDIGTPHYLGSVWSPERGRFWLILELVRGEVLRNCGLKDWIQAAAWLGTLHGTMTRQQDVIAHKPYLVQHERDYFESLGNLAYVNSIEIAPQTARRAERMFHSYAQILELVTPLPRTLVHGNYLATNILVANDCDGPRICAVDWEEAAYGSYLYDLASICDGFDPQALDRMLGSYRQEAERFGVTVPEQHRLVKIVHAFRLCRIMKFLSRSVEKRFSAEAVDKLLNKGEAVATQLAS